MSYLIHDDIMKNMQEVNEKYKYESKQNLYKNTRKSNRSTRHKSMCKKMTLYNKSNNDNYDHIHDHVYDHMYFNGINTITPVSPVLSMVESKYYQASIYLYCLPNIKESSYQIVTVYVPVNESNTVPVNFTHYIISYSDYMMQNKVNVVNPPKKYSAQFVTYDTYTNKRQNWNIDAFIIDIYVDKLLDNPPNTHSNSFPATATANANATATATANATANATATATSTNVKTSTKSTPKTSSVSACTQTSNEKSYKEVSTQTPTQYVRIE
jgi:hypothetical protein